MVIRHTGALLQTSKKCGLFPPHRMNGHYIYSLESVVHVVTGWVFQQNSWEIIVFVMYMYFLSATEKLPGLEVLSFFRSWC